MDVFVFALLEKERHPGHTQATPRRHPGDTQDTPRRHPGDTQETPGVNKKHSKSFSFGGFFCTVRKSATPRRHPGDTQETPRRHPGGTQEAPRRHPGGTQEAPRRHPGGTQGDPGHPGGSRRSWEQKCDKTIVFYHRKWRDRPFRVHETSATLTKYRKLQQICAVVCANVPTKTS